MHFALLGDHPDGLDMAAALAATGRHQLILYAGSSSRLPYLERLGLQPRLVGDLEEILADPHLDAVIVAGSLAVRAAQLRRALQAECHVLCVHPADPSPDIAYEAALIQADTGRVLLPLLPMTAHPGIVRLAELARSGEQANPSARLLEMEISSSDEVLPGAGHDKHKPSLIGWDILRFLGGEISEVFMLSAGAGLHGTEPCLVSGRFLSGGLFRATYRPQQDKALLRLTLGRANLTFPLGWPGPSRLSYVDEAGEERTQNGEAVHPWEPMVERFEQAVLQAALKKPQPGQPAEECLTKTPPLLGWQDELRGLELDDAARRSLERGRSSTLDLQETTEEASFKGMMTLVGCSMIWISLIVLILATQIPWLLWLIIPVFGVFLLLQGLRWILPGRETNT